MADSENSNIAKTVSKLLIVAVAMFAFVFRVTRSRTVRVTVIFKARLQQRHRGSFSYMNCGCT